MRAVSRLIAILGIGAVGGSALAAGVPLKPGKWEFVSTSRTPMASQPKVTTSTECVTESEFDPTQFVQHSGPCKIQDTSASGKTVTWKMVCSTPGGSSTGAGEFTSEETTARGEMKMTLNIGGESVAFDTSWQGKRLGDCE